MLGGMVLTVPLEPAAVAAADDVFFSFGIFEGGEAVGFRDTVMTVCEFVCCGGRECESRAVLVVKSPDFVEDDATSEDFGPDVTETPAVVLSQLTEFIVAVTGTFPFDFTKFSPLRCDPRGEEFAFCIR